MRLNHTRKETETIMSPKAHMLEIIGQDRFDLLTYR